MKLVDMVESQMIASVKSEEDLQHALTSNVNIVFLQTGKVRDYEKRPLQFLHSAGLL
ncbi:hypothetical protein QTL97_04285 [Sporosarcina thermotolerans]|uniref:Uncharacterized protein n=1 Tax=Sporosarcina thermotolerans TaxID=633404 RepID=A0AAW9AAC6_9BACL|nr:hypothetical protein [Sporosarcina thermotolerans]MDW0116141.1 hypothetical protein [Sporosarcina thermotolerans]WHT48113.1 hypothetical protein QNH10_19120 [Sporosarcina thermotolerans]